MRFEAIITQMPILFEKLEASSFVEKKNARTLPKNGIYVFYEELKPIYVGRSRNIAARVQAHSRPSAGHNSASFAFLLAKERAKKNDIDIVHNRSDLENDPSFAKIYTEEKERVAKMKIKAVFIEDPATQAIFEIYASFRLETPYNDWNTH